MKIQKKVFQDLRLTLKFKIHVIKINHQLIILDLGLRKSINNYIGF